MADCNHNHSSHTHGANCGHQGIIHQGHVDYLHDGHLHHMEGNKVEEHSLPVDANNPSACTSGHSCNAHEASHKHGPDCGHQAVPHGDHVDYLVDGHLHHPHEGHCDNHGKVQLA
jgi:hypothetical protein